jgi:site-specific recombinase XerD
MVDPAGEQTASLSAPGCSPVASCSRALPATVRRKLAASRTFFAYLFGEKIVENNPFSLLRGPKKPKSLPKVLPPRFVPTSQSTSKRAS